ncbi:carboxypeptidase-like regulatory domain-containing protein [Winogradskyella pacifica]|uniref:Carboxypeptidase family protein n=1 Tax=Winogradskyella pacifica TaxID=664642 RepID=A0A3D9N8M7_9FLAO|nr:carboxypeptidase-like regulatory domain-containing protein [Winogradskyella pacifica]REE27806.1 carboxypeptidase family protein [Winogradskyella pacifica]
MLKYFFVIFYTFILKSYCNAQQVQVQGQITDSLQKPLPYANILAIPETDDQDVKFAISENNGSYTLGLIKNQTYELTVSYLGYRQQTKMISKL